MSDADRSRTLLAQQLEGLLAAGVSCLPRADAGRVARWSSAAPAAEETSPAAVAAAAPPAPSSESAAAESAMPRSRNLLDDAGPTDDAAAAAPTLDALQQLVVGCTRCEELAAKRTQTVFGVGNPNARLCFVGEAPGADEDRLGEPFVGRAGQLLNKILEACKLSRDEVYILNVLKCRPPGNRNPEPAESANCRGFFDRQLDLIQPEFICCLGAVAARNLLDTQTAIGKLRGSVHDYRGIKVVCTYHPAYLLRNPAAKGATWEDMKLLMREMGQPVD
ncbi:MAG: uracil-DNA glycosylase [Planctomycetaceae bacterium]|nr:uracil-DNA glycosylase [Planctomycetaceae bacterium]